MKKSLLASFAAAALALSTFNVTAQTKDPDVGGVAMSPTKNVVQNASAAPNLSTLVAAVKAAGLADTLSGPGPFTVFAPDNDAFNKLPAGTVDTLLKPENKGDLTKILTYHVVSGKLDSKAIKKAIKKGHGTATLTTLQGGKLMAKMDGGKLVLTDEKGGTSTVTTANVYQSNGVAHVIDTVLMPN